MNRQSWDAACERIEDLEAKLAVAEALAAERTEQRNVALSRLAAAEAELERQKELTVWAQDEKAASEANADRLELVRELERLRVCGTCTHQDIDVDDDGSAYILDSTQADADTQFKLRAQAEADLAAWRAFCDEWVDIAFEVQQQDHKRCTQAEAEVALRDRMLVAEYDSPTPKTAGYMRWFADLRARAEKEAER